MKVEKVTSPEAIPKATITYVRNLVTRSTSSKQTKGKPLKERKGPTIGTG